MRNSYSSLFSFQNLGSPFPDQGFENLVRQIPQQRVSKITEVKLSEIVYFTFTDPAHKKYQIWIVNPQSNEIKHYNQILCFQQSTSPPIHVNMPSKKSKHAFFFSLEKCAILPRPHYHHVRRWLRLDRSVTARQSRTPCPLSNIDLLSSPTVVFPLLVSLLFLSY